MTDPRAFRFAVYANKTASGAEWRDLARKIEDLGYSTLFVSDHYLDRNLPAIAVMHVDPIAAMATAAAVTEKLHIGCRVFCQDYHIPSVLAKEATTLDLLSEGRLELGIGAGWSEKEYTSMGLTFDEPRRRVDKLEEVVALLKAHWSGEVMDCDGTYVKVKGYAGLPLPVRKPHPLLMIGGNRKRVLSLAAREADIVSFNNVPFVPINEAGLTPEQEAVRRYKVVQEAAGDRLGELELETAPYYSEITEKIDEAMDRVAATMKCSTEGLLDHPNVLIGSLEEVADRLLYRRDLLGVSYVTVPQTVFENFAPVVARLNGT